MAKTAYKSMHNWWCCPSSNWYKTDQKVLFWIWRSTRHHREKPQYRCTTV